MNLQPSVAPTPRSGIPKVVGILAIVFSSVGLLALSLPIGMHEDVERFTRHHGAVPGYDKWVAVYTLLALVLFGIHLTGGILSLRYSRRAPMMMTLYGVLALALIIANVVVTAAVVPGGVDSVAFDQLAGPRIGIEILALPWPIVVLALSNVRSARQACIR